MKKLRHSKYKNTGFLFELLTRQITADIISGRKSIAESLLAKYFRKGTELSKEHGLYQLLLKSKKPNITESSADRILDAVIDARRKLNDKVLGSQKYTLVKEIRDNFDIDAFFRSELPNYKELASIYKVFENATTKQLYNPTDVAAARTTIVESLIQPITVKKKDPILEAYTSQDSDIRHTSFSLLVRSFNTKYSTLSTDQKEILREYVNNVSNTNSLRETLNVKIQNVQKELKSVANGITDKVTIIKLNEVIKQLSNAKKGKTVRDSQITATMLAYELLEEIKNAL